MKALICVVVPILSVFAAGAQAQQATGKSFGWAYPVPDPPPPASADNGPKKVPGSSKTYTQAQIDDQFKPPDWFPGEHGPLPRVVEIRRPGAGLRFLPSDVGIGPPRVRGPRGAPQRVSAPPDGRFQKEFKKRSRSLLPVFAGGTDECDRGGLARRRNAESR